MFVISSQLNENQGQQERQMQDDQLQQIEEESGEQESVEIVDAKLNSISEQNLITVDKTTPTTLIQAPLTKYKFR